MIFFECTLSNGRLKSTQFQQMYVRMLTFIVRNNLFSLNRSELNFQILHSVGVCILLFHLFPTGTCDINSSTLSALLNRQSIWQNKMSTCEWKIIFEHLNLKWESVGRYISVNSIDGVDKQTVFQQLFYAINQLYSQSLFFVFY